MFCFDKLDALLQTFDSSSGIDYNEWESDPHVPQKNSLKLFFIRLTKYISSSMTIRKHLKIRKLNYTYSFCFITFLLLTQI